MNVHKILIVDDEEFVHEILDEHLRLAGYRRFHANNGSEAIKMILEKRPDLILMDIQMPVMDGFKTLATLRDKMGITDIPVVFLSNVRRQDLKVKGFELGGDDYVTKPFDSGELIARIRALLRRNDHCNLPTHQMSGNLADIALSDLLQSMELGNKTAHVHLDTIKGDIYIEAGELIHSRLGNFTGDAALQRIFLLEKGNFSIKFNQLPENIPSHPQPLTSVLMAMAANIDEINEILGQYNKGQAKITSDAPVSSYPAIEVFRVHFPITLRQLIILMGGTLKHNYKTIVKALEEKQLKII